MSKLKIAIIGAGSIGFTKKLFTDILCVPELQDIEVALTDISEHNLKMIKAILDKIVEGKLGSYYAQIVLPDQPSIRDPKMSVADVLVAAGKTLGAPITVTRFARLKVGEAAAQ